MVKCIELYVPVRDNEGHEVSVKYWNYVDSALRQRFNGYSTYDVAGTWSNPAGKVFRDLTRVYRIICNEDDAKEIDIIAYVIRRAWRQESVLYTVADIDATFV